MARLVDPWEYSSNEYELGEKAWFKPPYSDDYVQGEIVRVYNTRYDYHIEWRGSRYSVQLPELHRSCPDD